MTHRTLTYEAATVQGYLGVGLNRFRGWEGDGVTHGTLTLRGCHCPGVIWDGIEQV